MSGTTFKGGTLVLSGEERRTSLVVENGRVAHVGDMEATGTVVDVSGLLVLPGMVDTHVHLMDPGPTEREDFPTGTRAAAARGVTTIVEHTHAHPVRTVEDLRDKTSYLRGRSNVDYGLAAHVWPDVIRQIPALVSAGVTFFKLFTCDTHGVPGLSPALLSEGLRAVATVDGRALIHAEDQSLTAAAEKRLRDDGRVDPGLLVEWRSREAELVAVASSAVMALAAGAKVAFAHVSNPSVLDVIDNFRDLGATIAAEACPQYFSLEERELEDHGALRKFTPPARLRGDADRADMWQAVVDQRFSFFSTDHAPSTRAQKTEPDFWRAPFGLPGLDTTLPFLIDAALRGRLSLQDVVHLYARAPASWYSLPKGTLEVGADADLVLVDPEASWVVSDSDIISKAGWSPYSGRHLQGKVVATYLRGVEIARDGICHDLRSGRFLRPM